MYPDAYDLGGQVRSVFFLYFKLAPLNQKIKLGETFPWLQLNHLSFKTRPGSV